MLERTFRSLRLRNYRLYFIAQTVSMSGTWLQSVALSWLVLELTDSAVALGSTSLAAGAGTDNPGAGHEAGCRNGPGRSGGPGRGLATGAGAGDPPG